MEVSERKSVSGAAKEKQDARTLSQVREDILGFIRRNDKGNGKLGLYAEANCSVVDGEPLTVFTLAIRERLFSQVGEAMVTALAASLVRDLPAARAAMKTLLALRALGEEIEEKKGSDE